MFRFIFVVTLLYSNASLAQEDFHGIAKYKIYIEGSSEKKSDSITIIFGKNKIKTIFYYLSENGMINQNQFVDDITEKTTYTIDPQFKSYIKSTLKTENPFSFVNKYSYNAILSNLCLLYVSNDISSYNADYKSAECYGAIDFMYKGIKDYFFYGVQPVIIDNRIVFDYKVFQNNGMVQRVELTDISQLDQTDSYFIMDGLTEKTNQ